MFLWLKFNIYSLLLTAVASAIAAFLSCSQLFHNLYVSVPLGLCSLFVYSKAISIFKRYPYKKRIREKLISKGRTHYDQRLFLPYMGSPCMRSVVYFSLCELSRADDYRAIKKRAKKESDIFEQPRVVSITYDKHGGLIFSARDRITGTFEEI